MKRPPQTDAQKARNTVYRLLNIRLRSEKELYDKLKIKNISESVINDTIQYFKDLEFINDPLFAKQWIASRLKKPYGARRIRLELIKKGIAKDIIDKELALATSDEEEIQTAIDLAQHRATKYTGIEPEKIRQRIYSYLSRRGFNSPAISKAINQL